MVTNHTITDLTDTTVKAEADFTATHRIEDGFWVLGGSYSYDLVKDGADRKVTRMSLQNADLLTERSDLMTDQRIALVTGANRGIGKEIDW